MRKLKNTMLTENLRKYGLMAGAAIGAVSNANAEIIYTDVDPDASVTNASFDIDINDDEDITENHENHDLREFACLTTVILATLLKEGSLHTWSATSLPRIPRIQEARERSMGSLVYFARKKLLLSFQMAVYLRQWVFRARCQCTTCRGYANVWVHANLKTRNSRCGVLSHTRMS